MAAVAVFHAVNQCLSGSGWAIGHLREQIESEEVGRSTFAFLNGVVFIRDASAPDPGLRGQPQAPACEEEKMGRDFRGYS
jgi:hypothetical protein